MVIILVEKPYLLSKKVKPFWLVEGGFTRQTSDLGHEMGIT